MSESDPYHPPIAWRRGFKGPDREPVLIDIQDGRAEYLLSGPYRMAEGSKIEVLNGKLVWTGGRSRVS